MSPLTAGSRSGSPRKGGGGGPRPPSGTGSSVSLTPLSPAAASTSKAAAGAFFAALTSCLMPEAFTGDGDFEEYLQHLTTAARFSG